MKEPICANAENEEVTRGRIRAKIVFFYDYEKVDRHDDIGRCFSRMDCRSL
jgi:hypothetical protein